MLTIIEGKCQELEKLDGERDKMCFPLRNVFFGAEWTTAGSMS